MLNARDRVLNATILYPDTRIPGGVAVFVETMRRSFDDGIRTRQFVVGRRVGDTGVIKAVANTLGDALRLVWHIFSVRPDVVHINPSLNVRSLFRDGLFLLLLRLLNKREVLMFMHGWDEGLSSKISGSRVFRAAFRYIYGWPAMTIVLASRFRRQLLSMGFCAERIRVDSAMFDGSMFEGLARRSHKDCRLVFVSRLVAGKGMWELLDAYASLKASRSDLALWVVGDGEDRERFVQAVRASSIPDVTVTGFVSRDTKAQILLDGDLFVFPTSYAEGCPASLLEAMGAGLPCITTGVGGIPDVFEDKVNGVILQEVSAQTIGDAVLEFLSDRQRMEATSRENHRTAWKHFESVVVSSRIATDYRRMVSEP